MPRRRDRGRPSKQALRIARRSTATFNQSIPLRHSSHENNHIRQNGRSPRKEVPRPCWCVSNACAASPHCDLSRRMCTVADFSCYSPPHGSLLHCRFVNTTYACAISMNSWILIVLPSQAPSSSTASTRSPLLSPTVSSTHSSQYL